MNYSIFYHENAIVSLEKLSKNLQNSIIKKIKWLSDNIENINHISFVEDRFKDLFKMKIGNYRILYSLDKEKKQLIIHLIGHRKEIYKR